MSIIAENELALAAQLVEQLVHEWLDDEPTPERAADLERLTLSVQAPFCWPHTPPELEHALVRELARRGDELAAGVLAGIARLAGESLAGLAVAEVRALEGRGITSPLAAAVACVEVVDALRLEVGDGAAEIWLVAIGRAGTEDVQPMTVFVEQHPEGTLIAEASLGAPMERVRAVSLLDQADGTPTPVSAEVLACDLRAALEAMARDHVGLDVDAGRVLPLLERALTGHAGRFVRPPAQDPEEAEREAADLVVYAFEAWLDDADAELREHAPFVAHTMLEFKLDRLDDGPARWDAGELREYLLDWFPREVTCDDATIPLATAAVSEFLVFLDEAGVLEAPVAVQSLAAAVRRLQPAFERACRDPARWGPEKRVAVELLDDDEDLESPEAWLDANDARLHAAPDPRRRERRKAARTARNRNRR